MRFAIARGVLRLASLLVPGGLRREWLEEWRAEVDALARMEGPDGRPEGVPGAVAFALGAVPDALSMMREGWTMDGMLQDLRYAIRGLRRAPGFAFVAALTLALGIGANATIFSLVNGLVLQPPSGIAEADELVQIARSYDEDPRWDTFSWPAFRAIEEESTVFEGVAGYSDDLFVIGSGAESERVIGQLVTGRYFELLRVQPALGRLIQPQDDVTPGAHPVVVLSHGLWVRRYGSDPSVVGRTIQIGAQPYTVVGVTAESFVGPRKVGFTPALYVPTAMHVGYRGTLPFNQWGWSWVHTFARLTDGATVEAARASMMPIDRLLEEGYEPGAHALVEHGFGLMPYEQEEAERLAVSMAVIVGLVLLLTCTSVANLFIARSSSRRTEMSVRSALGAGRARLMGMVGAESGVLAAFATLLAVPIVASADRLLPALVPLDIATAVGADARVWGFLLVVGAATGLLFGGLPAWSISRAESLGGVRGGTAADRGRGATRLRGALVTVQLGLSLGLVTGAALLGRSVWNARVADPGFDPTGLTATFVDLESTGRYGEDDLVPFFEQLHAAASEAPGIAEVTLAGSIPIATGQNRGSVYPNDDRVELGYEAENVVVGPGYFEMMGIPILQGRAVGDLDDPEPGVVINRGLANRFWPGEDAVGREVTSGGGQVWRVVGVVGDVQFRSLRAAGNPAIYYPVAHAPLPSMALIARGPSGAAVEGSVMRAVVQAIDPGLPRSSIIDVERSVRTSLRETGTIGWLVAAFAGLALVLAVVGLYGLVAFGASQRRREFGIRIALGARPDELTRLVLGRGTGVAVLGLVLGLGVTWGIGRAVSSLLFRVGALDLPTFGIAAVILMTAGGLAAWVPARRAGRVDAAVSLRE